MSMTREALVLDEDERVFLDLSPAELIEHAIANGEGRLSARGAFTAITSPYTGRSPKDKFVVQQESIRDRVAWGHVNQPISEDSYDGLRAKVVAKLNESNRYVAHCHVGAHPAHQLSVRLVSERAWSTLFARNMFIRPVDFDEADFTVLHAPSVKADPAQDGTNSEAFVVLNFDRREVIIGGTSYAGEIKKSMFSVMNYLMPLQDVFPMHCSANIGSDGSTAVFFGLSGTGKTTLSADAARTLIGDDEHGWGPEGVFNFEGGCYAKVIKLSAKAEPEIHAASHRFGAVLENVVLDSDTRIPNLDDGSITENTRACYPIEFIPNAKLDGLGGHPTDIVFLTADAFGVLPPISRLDHNQAAYYFLSGYTAKVAGTERGVTEPEAAFSVCFGSPFLPLPPKVYGELLIKRLKQHNSRVWLVNTGWTQGPYGVGHRMELADTRAMLRAALGGHLDNVTFVREPHFGLSVPTNCPDVDVSIMNPRDTWRDAQAYDEAAKKLAEMFKTNFERFDVSDEIRAAGPT